MGNETFRCNDCNRVMLIELLEGDDFNPMWCPYCGSEELHPEAED
jgi:Zn finger protein HypA/HybF involved in hydrogenase expression